MAILALSVFLAYVPSLGYGFIHDDTFQILNNPQVHSWEFLPRLLTTDMWSQQSGGFAYYYRPAYSIFLLAGYTGFEATAWMWHECSILLQIAATVLVWFVGLSLGLQRGRAIVAAIIFALHPIHIEAVCWISASNEILYTIAALLCILAWLRKWPAWALVGTFLCALGFKETALSLVLVLPVLVLAERPADWDHWKKVLKRFALILSSAALYLLARMVLLHHLGVEAGRHTWRQVIFTAPSVLVFYLQKLALPVKLSGFYLNRVHSEASAGFWAGIVLFAAVGALCVFFVRSRNLAGAVGCALLILPILPALLGIRIFLEGNMAHDRYLYLPSVGLCVLLASVLPEFRSLVLRRVSIGILAVVCVLMCVLIWSQESPYRDEINFYQRGIDLYPENNLVRLFMGNAYSRAGDAEAAVTAYRIAYEGSKEDPVYGVSLASGLAKASHSAEAETLLQNLRFPADDIGHRSTALLLLGNSQFRLGRSQEAEQNLRALIALNPSYAGAHRSLAIILQHESRFQEAADEYLKEYAVSGDEQCRKQGQMMKEALSRKNF